MGDCIVNLDTIVQSTGRSIYPFEKGDKLNYTTSILDTETQIVTFTHPKIIAAFAGTRPDQQLSYCEQSLGYLSLEAQLRVATEIIKVGNIEKGMQMIENINKKLEWNRKDEEERNKGIGRK